MPALNFKSVVLVALVTACASFGTGCYADAQVQAEPVAVEGYRPQYYDGYVVYYDEGGRPFYYNGGAQYYVPNSSPYYGGYVNHWRTYGVGYRNWYGRYGGRYRGYHGPSRYYRRY
jgi:hypothetical protein